MIVIVMGVSGCGKTTIGRDLAAACGWEFLDADDFHPPGNIARMATGTPLTDDDRAAWLRRLRAAIAGRLAAGRSLVLACSALRESYRAELRRPGEAIRFVHLRGDAETIRRRLAARAGHFMPAALLDSQFATLEEPEDALVVPVELPPPAAVLKIIQGLQLCRQDCPA